MHPRNKGSSSPTCPLQLLGAPRTPATHRSHLLLRTRLKLDTMDAITPFLTECFSFLQNEAER